MEDDAWSNGSGRRVNSSFPALPMPKEEMKQNDSRITTVTAAASSKTLSCLRVHFIFRGRQGRWCSVDQCVFSTAMSVLPQTQTSLGQLSFLTQSFYWHVCVLLLSGRYFLIVFSVCIPSSSSLLSRLFCFAFFLRLVFLYGPRRQILKLTTSLLPQFLLC